MTLTPAIREALRAYAKEVLRISGSAEDEMEAEERLLSVVAAEEGRKYEGKIYTKEDAEALCEVTRAAIVQHYEPLVKLVKEWQEAVKEEEAALWLRAKDVPIEYEVVDVWLRAFDRKEAALSALAQWEAK